VTAHRAPRPHWLTSPRWLATGGAVLLAGVLGVALLLQNGGGACAAPPTSAKHQGKATFYDLAGTQGNCSFDPPADGLYVALGVDEYSDSLACGSYLDVTGPQGKVRVKVFDKCPECTPGWLDLSRTAFKKIASESQGVVPITYKAVPNAATPGPLTITFMEGASQYWWAIIIDNHANPIASVKAKGSGGTWMTAGHEDYNAWLIDQRTGTGPFQIRMTDIYGNVATAKNIKLTPTRRQQTSVRFAGAQSSTKKSPTPRSSSSAPSPSRSPSPFSAGPSAVASAPAAKASPSVTPASTAAQAPSTVEVPPQQDLALTAGEPTSTC
jgi:expansin (peptidoglycan-binding protein)